MGGGWQGGGWQGGGWAGGGGSEGMYAMRPDRPLVAEDVSTTPPPADGNTAPKFPRKAWDDDLFTLTFLPDFFTAAQRRPGTNTSHSVHSPMSLCRTARALPPTTK
jgi:hypothetical protein